MISGVLAALAGVAVGGWLAHRSEARQWERNCRMNAYAELVRAYTQVYAALVRHNREGGAAAVDWSDWNRALAMVSIVARHSTATQAVAIDEAFWRLAVPAPRPSDGPTWRADREPLENAVLAFVNLARAELDVRGGVLHRLTGRPVPDDPVWRPAGHGSGQPGDP
jgi:hypothetical protein